jgi:single-stranded-DNA-specific exonuclease
VADVAPLVGDNRTSAWLGLQGLTDPRNPGLRALMRRLGMLGRPLRAVDVGFKIGPRINAAGRLASANTAIELFHQKDEDAAWVVCAELDRMNAERQEIEQQVRIAAEEEIRGDERIIILAKEQWHKGVLGLTAGRIAQKYHRPTLVMTIEGDRCVGSARSIPSINLHGQLEEVADLFTHFGGHEYACGFSLQRENLEALRERLTAKFAKLDDALFIKEATVDAVLTLGEIDRAFIDAHELLQPFGAGNPQPLFLTRRVEVVGTRTFAEDCCELMLDDGSGRVAAVVWPSVKQLAAEIVQRVRADVLVQVEPDSYAAAGARLTIIDARAAEPLSSRA